MKNDKRFLIGEGYNQSNRRNFTLDLVKGMGIILMVYRHARGPLSEYVTLFHMALFFIASGFLYPSQGINTPKEFLTYVIRKLKGLWLPYFIFSTLFILCHNLFLNINIYTDNPEFLKYVHIDPNAMQITNQMSISLMVRSIVDVFIFRGGTQIGGALWFFQTLFYVLILYAAANVAIKLVFPKGRYSFVVCQGIIALIFLLMGYFCHIKGFAVKGLDKVFSVYCLVYIGNIMRQYHVMDILFKELNVINNLMQAIILIIFSMIIIINALPRGYIAIVENEIENPIYFIIVSIAGWTMLYGISTIFIIFHFVGIKAISYMGKHSVFVVALHFLAFKIVNVLGVWVLGMPKYLIASFPIFFQNGFWWIAYTIVGVVVPLMAEYGWSFILTKLRSKKK